jgi:rRNA-processing protein FCF1
VLVAPLQLEVYKSMMDCLLAKCTPCISDCVMAELEKLGSKYALALRYAQSFTLTHGGGTEVSEKVDDM